MILKKIKDETIDLYQKIVQDSRKIVIANKTNATEPRLKTLEIFGLLEEILIKKKAKGSQGPKSEKLDTTTGGKDTDDI